MIYFWGFSGVDILFSFSFIALAMRIGARLRPRASRGDTSPMQAAGKAGGQMRKYAVLSKTPPKEQKKASFAELGLRDESEPSPSGMMSRREPKRGGLARATGPPGVCEPATFRAA